MSFYLSKILWLVINPFNLFVFLNIVLVFLYFVKYKKVSKFIFLFNFLFLFLISVFPIGKFLIYKIEKEYHSNTMVPDNLDGILILGGSTNPLLYKDYNQIVLNDSAERLIESIKIINKFKETKVIFSGGSGILGRPDLEHAEAAKYFYKEMKINTKKIIFENKSRNTYENILFSKDIANPKKNENWLLITSASHMKRATLVAYKLDWHLIPYAVDFRFEKKFIFRPRLEFLKNINHFQNGIHEWIGLIYYYLMDRTDRIF